VIDISQESNFQNNTKNQISVDEKLLLMGRKALYGDRILPKPSSQNRKDYERKESPKEELDNRLNEVNNNEIKTKVPAIAVIPFPFRSLLLRKTQTKTPLTTPYNSYKKPESNQNLVKNSERYEKPFQDNLSSSIDSLINNEYNDNLNTNYDNNHEFFRKYNKRTTRLPHNYHQNYVKSRKLYHDYYSSNNYSIPTTEKYYNKNNYFSKKSDYNEDNYKPTAIPLTLGEEVIEVSTDPINVENYGYRKKSKEYEHNNDYRPKQNSYHLYQEKERPQKKFDENLYLPHESPQEIEIEDNVYDNNKRNHELRDEDIRDKNVRNQEFGDQISGQIPHPIHEEYTEYPKTPPTDDYSGDHEPNSYPESHTIPSNYDNQNEQKENEIQEEDEPYIESDLQRIPNYNTQNFPRLKGQRIPKLYNEQNQYQYTSERPQTPEYEPNSYHYSSETPERPEYEPNSYHYNSETPEGPEYEPNSNHYSSETPERPEFEPNSYHYSSETPERPEYDSNTETTPYSYEDSEPIPPSHHYGGDGIEDEPEDYSGPHSLDNRPPNHPLPHDKYHESASDSPPLEVVSHNNEQNHEKHNENNENNDSEDNNYGGYDDHKESEEKNKKLRNKTKILKTETQKPNINLLRQLFSPQTEVLSEYHTFIFPVKVTYPSKLTSNAMRNAIENILSRV
jgi:hypothetical protein